MSAAASVCSRPRRCPSLTCLFTYLLTDVLACFLIPDQGGAPLSSEYKRQFKYGAGSFNAQGKRKPFGSDNPGLRSEEMITVGQYTPVLRSF